MKAAPGNHVAWELGDPTNAGAVTVHVRQAKTTEAE